jgi:hypothetical protein
MSRRFITACILATLVLAGGLAWGACWDDQSFFTVSVKPRAMLVLDRSGSMLWDFAGNCCYSYGDPRQRLTAATTAIKGVLDADSNGVVNAADELSLGVQMGYSYFYNTSLTVPRDTMGMAYTTLWSHIDNGSATGGTPGACAAWTALQYVVGRRNLDPLRGCRPYFIIMMTDGGSNSDYICGSSCSGDIHYADDSYKSGRYSEMNVGWTSRTQYGIPMYWVGMGSTMPQSLQNTLNWAAFFGGTDDPTVANAGDTSRCTKRLLGSVPDCTWLGNNPGDVPGSNLSGYAFIGNDGTRLGQALKTIFRQIQQSGGQTFAMSSLPANFAKGAMYYWSSFEPKPAPRWLGHVAALKFYPDGSPPFDSLSGNLDSTRLVWDAGNILRSRAIDTDPLTIYTWTGTERHTMLNDFARVLPETLGFAAGDTSNRNKTVRFVYGDSVSGGHTWGWLNDPFHGYTVEVKEPSWIYLPSSPTYLQFINQYKTRPARVHVLVNDGKMHCFNGDTISPPGGRELWSYVPRHMLTSLSAMRVGHAYNMDGPMVVRHIFAYADSMVANNWYDWRTILVSGERNGGRYYFALDVTDPAESIDPMRAVSRGGNGKRPYPWPMWEVGPTTAGLADMGYTWSTPSIWKMKILRGGNPHRPDTCWVAVVGGGYDCQDLTKGRFIAVLDAFSGEVIRRLDLGAGAGPVAAPVTLADFDRNGTVDHLYVGDLNGNVWRFDVSDSVVANWQRSPNAAFFDEPNNRPIYGGITLGASGLDSTWIFFGTGDRDNPFSQLNNRVYGIRDIMDDNPVAVGLLDNVTGGGSCTSTKGWFKQISSASDTSAIFSMPITAKFSDSVFTMGWKAPGGSALACSSGAAGNTYLYSFYKTCGNNVNYRRFISAGMPPGEFPHGIDKRGRHKGVAIRTMVHLETYLIGKIVKSWREVY